MKKTKIFVTTMMISIILAVPAFAGEWKANANGWWYENDDGSYPVAQWKEVNGKYYYFGTDGYIQVILTKKNDRDSFYLNKKSCEVGENVLYCKGKTLIHDHCPISL